MLLSKIKEIKNGRVIVKDSKMKDNQQVVQVYRGVEIIYDDVKGEYWCRRAGATLALKDNDISKLKKSLDIYLEGKGYDSSDIYTKDGSLDDEIKKMAREKSR